MAHRFYGRALARALTPFLALALFAIPQQPAAAQQASSCDFVLGFKTLHELDPADTGDCVENQSFASNGDAQQHTTKGIMVWRKADNTSAFTNGFRTWLLGPDGLVNRLNSGPLFSWEAPPAPAPAATPVPQPTAVAQPATPAKLAYPWYFKKVTEAPTMCGQSGQGVPCVDSAPNAGTQYIGGHVIKHDNTPASGMIVQASVYGNFQFNTTGDDGLFSIIISTNCPSGPIPVDVWLVDGGMHTASYTNHILYTNCQQAGEFHFDFIEAPV